LANWATRMSSFLNGRATSTSNRQCTRAGKGGLGRAQFRALLRHRRHPAHASAQTQMAVVYRAQAANPILQSCALNLPPQTELLAVQRVDCERSLVSSASTVMSQRIFGRPPASAGRSAQDNNLIFSIRTDQRLRAPEHGGNCAGGMGIPIYICNLYPISGTVMIISGFLGCASTFWRRLAMCISTVRVSVPAAWPQTSFRSSSRDTVIPRCSTR
jgi:hypothetical protein